MTNMQQHRRREGLAWGVALLAIMTSGVVGIVSVRIAFWVVIVGLVAACVIYYR